MTLYHYLLTTLKENLEYIKQRSGYHNSLLHDNMKKHWWGQLYRRWLIYLVLNNDILEILDYGYGNKWCDRQHGVTRHCIESFSARARQGLVHVGDLTSPNHKQPRDKGVHNEGFLETGRGTTGHNSSMTKTSIGRSTYWGMQHKISEVN